MNLNIKTLIKNKTSRERGKFMINGIKPINSDISVPHHSSAGF
jgi:hypothetical protein